MDLAHIYRILHPTVFKYIRLAAYEAVPKTDHMQDHKVSIKIQANNLLYLVR